jgi:hypothetical protein
MALHRLQRRIDPGGICFGIGSVSHLLVPVATGQVALKPGHRSDSRHGAWKKLREEIVSGIATTPSKSPFSRVRSSPYV